MKVLPANLIKEKNKLSTKNAWLLLVEITLNNEAGTVLRFVRNFENITYNGNTYTKFNFDLEQSSDEGKGQIPTWKLKICNVTCLLEPYLDDLDGAVGSVIKIIPVNTGNLNEDYSNLEKTFDILACQSDAKWVQFTLGAPNPLRQPFPADRFLSLHCRFRFETAECGYSRKTVADVTLSGSDPVSIEVINHGFSTGDSIRLADIAGITPSLDGTSIITKTNDDNFTLDDTDSSDYSGSYTSGGTAGYSSCQRRLSDCRERENAARFGGCPALRTGTLKIA